MQHSEDITALREELIGYIHLLGVPQLRLVLSFLKTLFTL